MWKNISKSLWLMIFAVIICCVLYPAVVWSVGQSVFPFQANGSMVGSDGKPQAFPDDATAVGSVLIAQPFTKDEYFQPRPSACNYDASASSSQAWAASNYQLRNRVAVQLGPIVTYKSGPKAGQPVASDIEAWFQKDRFAGSASIVAQWADAHNGLAQAWVGTTFDPKNPTPQQQYVLDWEKTHAAVVSKFKSDNPSITSPAPGDLAIVFFETFSKENPGKFLSLVTPPAPATQPTAITGATAAPTSQPSQVIMAVNTGSDIQSDFFDMWRQDHADADLQDVPSDLVTTSGSGLDPNISLQNAEYQLDRISSKWASDTKRDAASVRNEIEQIIQNDATAPFNGIAGEKMINVLQVNLELKQRYGSPS